MQPNCFKAVPTSWYEVVLGLLVPSLLPTYQPFSCRNVYKPRIKANIPINLLEIPQNLKTTS